MEMETPTKVPLAGQPQLEARRSPARRRKVEEGPLDYILLPFKLIAFFIVLFIDFIVFISCLFACFPLWVLQKCGFVLSPPFNHDTNMKSDVLLITVPGLDSYYMSDDLADRLELLCKGYAKSTAGRVRCMIADERLGQEFEKMVSDPAEALFWKIHWKYPNHALIGPDSPLHYHAVLSVRREVNDQNDYDHFRQSILDLGLRVRCYQVAREKVIEQLGDDHFERYAKISFGRSTVWEIPTMQRMARFEAIVLWGEGAAQDIRKRVIYWTRSRPTDLRSDEQDLGFFSYESHNSLDEMLFENWRMDFGMWNRFFILFSGMSSIIYSGFMRNRAFEQNKVTFAQLRRHMGFFYAAVCYLHKTCFYRRQCASNQAILTRSRVFDYRDTRVVQKSPS